MTKVKKMLGMVMAALLCFALTPAAAFAADSGNVKDTRGTITITNAIPGQEYKLYEIFQLESYNNTAHAYSYKLVSDGWTPFFQGAGAAYASIDDQGYVTWKQTVDGTNGQETAGGAEFAKAAIEYATANGISETTKATAPAAEGDAETVELVFSNLELGYYLVSSSIGTICSLNSTHSDVKITDKNEKPSITKEVQEISKVNDDNEGWGEDNNANIGDTVNFRSTITGQAGARNYVFHDTMSAGLTFIPSSVAITLNGNTIAETTYKVVQGGATNHKEGDKACTFEVVFTQDFCNTIAANDKIVVSYQATLNENAVISGEANTNESKLSYGSEDRTVTTPPSTTKTYTGGFNVFKHNEAGEGLAGAVFTVSKLENGSNPLAFVQLDEADARAEAGVPTYRPVVAGETGITEIKTIDNGKFKIVGLDEGEYFLTEITAPDGYNKLAAAKSVMVSENENGGSVLDFGDAKVENKTGLELPSTGGVGTVVLYVIGGVLVLGAVIFLVARRRSSAK